MIRFDAQYRMGGTEYQMQTNVGIRGPQGAPGAAGAPGADGADGKSLEFNWSGTRLGVRVAGTSSYSYVDLKGADGSPGTDGSPGAAGAPGADGRSLEFVWDGTRLGIRVQGESTYQYTELRGEDGAPGTDGQPGPRGISGVYVGAGDMPEGYNVQIDPSGSGDEIITAENIKSALGYTPADSADLATKLPKSPANWEAWTAEEQEAARDRIGIDKPFELIEEIVCDGEATTYTRTVDVNGNPYNLLSVYIEFEIETGNSYTSPVFFRAYDAESNTVLYEGSLVNQKNYVSYLFGAVDAKNGMYQGWMISANISSYNSGGSYTKRINRRAPIISPIKKIYIMVGGGLKFLSGDKIRIYGVRA